MANSEGSFDIPLPPAIIGSGAKPYRGSACVTSAPELRTGWWEKIDPSLVMSENGSTAVFGGRRPDVCFLRGSGRRWAENRNRRPEVRYRGQSGHPSDGR